MAKKGLGRGFSTLIPTDILIDDQFDPTLGVDHEISKLQEIPLAKISADPDQPRWKAQDQKWPKKCRSV